MKTTDELLVEMREALAHHDGEAKRLRAGIVALVGEAVQSPTLTTGPCVRIGPWPQFAVWPPPGVPVYVGDPPPYEGPFAITVSGVGLALCASGLLQ